MALGLAESALAVSTPAPPPRGWGETRESAAIRWVSGSGTESALSPDNSAEGRQPEDSIMLHWAAVFFVIALLAAIFGFGGIAASAAGVAKILFVVFLVLAVVSLIFGRRVST